MNGHFWGDDFLYRILACDLDETLISRDRSISVENIDAITQALRLGIKFVPATGRSFASVQTILKTLGLHDVAGQYVISFNGGVITENKDNRIISLRGISFELASDLFKAGLQYDVSIHVYTIDKLFIKNLTRNESDYIAGRMEAFEIFDQDLEFLKGQDIVKILYANPDFDYLQDIEVDLKALTDDVATVSYSSNRYIEFNRLGVDKGSGLNLLADLLGIDMKATIAIGDNYNDLTMILGAGLGVGVQNTVEAIKSHCDYICQTDHNQSAVAEVINKFILKDYGSQILIQ